MDKMFLNIRSKQAVLLLAFAAALVFAACRHGADIDEEDVDISFTATANGGSSQATNKIYLAFSDDVPDLTAADITIGGSEGKANKGVLTKTDSKNWTLHVTTTKRGQAEVSIAKSGISADARNVRLYLLPLTILVNGGYTGGITVRYVDNPASTNQKTISGNMTANGAVTLDSQPPTGVLAVSIEVGTNTIYVGRVIAPAIVLALKLNSSGALQFRPADSDGKIPIGTYSEFQMINGALSGNYKQEDDIDLMGNGGLNVPDWEPIGTSTAAFSGTYDGDGKQIMRLYINDSERSDVGLFGVAGTTATLNNVNIASGSVTGKEHVGGVLGLAESGSSGTISECSNAASITGKLVAGIVGLVDSNDWIIYGCSNSGSISGYVIPGSNRIGGVVGLSLSSVIRCFNSGNIETINNGGFSTASMGGVVGHITGPSSSDSGSPVSLFACYNTGDVSGKYSELGGVLGASSGEVDITACYNTGNVTGPNYQFSTGNVGGVLGASSGEVDIKACYNTGDLSGSAYIGGIAGRLISSEDSIIACYNTGKITDTWQGNEASILYEGRNGVSVQGCYWRTGTASVPGPSGGDYTAFAAGAYFTPDPEKWTVGDGSAGKYWKDGTTEGGILPKLWYQD